MRLPLVLFAFSIALFAAPAAAHPGPHHDIERLTKLLLKDPTRVDWLMARAQAYRLDGQFLQALADLDRAAKLNGDVSLLALERGLSLAGLRRDPEAEAELTKHLTGPRPTAGGYGERAAIRERRGRKAEAVADLTAAIALVPKVDWYLARGRLQESLDRLDDAAKGYRDGLTQCSGAVALRLELLRLEISRGRFDLATDLIDEVLPQADLKTDWYLRRADVQNAAGKPKEAGDDRARALAEAERAVARRPTALRLLMRAKVFIALDQKEQAAADLQAALRKAPSLAEAADLLNRLERKTDTKGPVAPVTTP